MRNAIVHLYPTQATADAFKPKGLVEKQIAGNTYYWGAHQNPAGISIKELHLHNVFRDCRSAVEYEHLHLHLQNWFVRLTNDGVLVFE